MATSRGRRIARAVAVVVALAAAGGVLARYAGQVDDGFRDLDRGWLAVAALAVVAGTICPMLSWRALLADLGSPLRLKPAALVFFLAQIGKYVPGSVWALAAQVELGLAHGVPRKRAAAATLVALGLSVMGGAIVASGALLVSPELLRDYWWALLVIPAGAVVLHPPVFSHLANTALKLAKRQPLEHPLSRRGELVALGWALASWLFFGVHVWALARGLGATGGQVLPLATAGFALAWTAGFLVIFLPAGAGIREAVLVIALGPVLSRSDALALALVSRMLMTGVDVLFAAIAAAARWPGGRRARETAREENRDPVA